MVEKLDKAKKKIKLRQPPCTLMEEKRKKYLILAIRKSDIDFPWIPVIYIK